AIAMVEEECRRYRPTKNYLEHLPALSTSAFETDLMTTEFERIQNRLPMEPVSMKRYELPPPPAGKMSEVSAWMESVENSMAQLEHQAVRALNLELMQEYGCEMWKSYLEVLTAMQAKPKPDLKRSRKYRTSTGSGNRNRPREREKLRSLEAQWVMLVSRITKSSERAPSWKKIYQKKTEKGMVNNSSGENINNENLSA
ncbi:hypothetical protein pipiens_012914, partial [Culex pipiens pipiens]